MHSTDLTICNKTSERTAVLTPAGPEMLSFDIPVLPSMLRNHVI